MTDCNCPALPLAQALRVIRDSTDGYAANVARRALDDAGVPDPADPSWFAPSQKECEWLEDAERRGV